MTPGYSLPLNRRLYERYKAEASATLVIDKNIARPSFLKDLSFQGAGIIADYPLQPEQKVAVIIHMPFFFAGGMHKEARVVWCRQSNSGLWDAGLEFGKEKS